jgi:hypothetical protein
MTDLLQQDAIHSEDRAVTMEGPRHLLFPAFHSSFLLKFALNQGLDRFQGYRSPGTNIIICDKAGFGLL